MDLKVFYVATRNTSTVHNYQGTLDIFGYDHHVLGMGEKWGGWRYRMQKYEHTCQKEDPNQLVLLTDAEDVLAVKEPMGFREQFLAFNKPIVLSMEFVCSENCVPLNEYWKLYPEVVTSNRYVNCGLIAGFAGPLAKMWRWILDQGFQDDQMGLGNYVNTFPLNVSADYQNKLFYFVSYAIHPELHWQPTKDKCHRLQSVSVGKEHFSPYFLHFSGHFREPQTKSAFSLDPPIASYYDPSATKLLGDVAMKSLQTNQLGRVWALTLFYSVFIFLVLFIIVLVIIIILHRRGIISLSRNNKTLGKLDNKT